MGTRIKKVMGYGKKITAAKGKAIFKQYDNEPDPDKLEHMMKAAYDAAEASHDDHILSLAFECNYPNHHGEYPRLGDVVHTAYHPDDPKGGNVVFLTPMCFKQWFRFSDDLDHTEFFARHAEIKDEVLLLEGPLYPYLNWMHPTTCERLKYYSNIIGRKKFIDEHGEPPVPEVPHAIRVIAKHFKVDWKKLRPMIVTWWS